MDERRNFGALCDHPCCPCHQTGLLSLCLRQRFDVHDLGLFGSFRGCLVGSPSLHSPGAAPHGHIKKTVAATPYLTNKQTSKSCGAANTVAWESGAGNKRILSHPTKLYHLRILFGSND
jgi:hypothetical protein